MIKKYYFSGKFINPLIMVNILVPTDFSDLSKVSIDFAVKVANKLDANITLLHVVNVIQATRASMRLRLEALEEEIISIAKEDIHKLQLDVLKSIKTPYPVKTKVVKGTSFNDTVKREAKKLRSGLIVMGTRGASGIRKVVIGSNTASLIEVSHIPVLVVPELAQFKNFKNIIYATDLRHIDKEIKALLPYVEIFGSTVHVFHVAANQKAANVAEEKIKKALAKVEYGKFIVKIVVAKNIDKALEEYMDTAKGDLLTTFAYEHSFYEKLFDRSLTRKLAFQTKLPLLAFKQQ